MCLASVHAGNPKGARARRPPGQVFLLLRDGDAALRGAGAQALGALGAPRARSLRKDDPERDLLPPGEGEGAVHLEYCPRM